MAGDMTGNEARALRLGMSLSARALALLVGTNESSIYRWEWRKQREVPRMYALALRMLVNDHASADRDADEPPPKVNNG
jgi:DNA-binding transcriptional regulator YiaG